MSLFNETVRRLNEAEAALTEERKRNRDLEKLLKREQAKNRSAGMMMPPPNDLNSLSDEDVEKMFADLRETKPDSTRVLSKDEAAAIDRAAAPKADKHYAVEYQYRGAKWAANLWAADEEDARRKLRAMAHGVVVGEIKAVVRVPTWGERLLRWVGIDRGGKP